MSDYIFVSEKCLKKDIYSFLVDKLIEAGWENVSSNPNTDFDVFYSTGMDGDKNLYFQMRPTNSNNTNSIIDTDYCLMSLRLISNYTPNEQGKSGTFERDRESWRDVYLAPVSNSTRINYETEVTIYYHVNKNRLIFSIVYPIATGINPVTHYIGIPDEIYVLEPDSKGLLYVSSTSNPAGNNGVLITDNIYSVTGSTSAVTRSVYFNLAPKNPNADGYYFLSEALYGNSSEGIRGKLTGLYFLPNENIISEDIIQIGEKSFKVIVNGNYGNNGFPSHAVAFQI